MALNWDISFTPPSAAAYGTDGLAAAGASVLWFCGIDSWVSFLIYWFKPNSIMLSGRRQVRSWSQTCSELVFGLSSKLASSELARASTSATSL